jgi:hypothetical protein
MAIPKKACPTVFRLCGDEIMMAIMGIGAGAAVPRCKLKI